MRPSQYQRQAKPAPRRRAQFQLAELNLGRKHRPDYWLLILSATLLAIGLIVVYAISPALTAANHVGNNYYVGKQLLAIGLSVIAFFVTARVPLKWWRQAWKPLLIVAAVATILALIIPVNPAYPAHRWVRLGSLSFQSVELVKFALMIWLAAFLAARLKQGAIANTQLTLKPILIALLVIGVVVTGVQSDLGSTGVMVAMIATMGFVAGLPMRRILLIGGVIMIGLVLAISATPYRRERLTSFLHPEAHCQSSGYQACQALIAVGSGGMIGLGLGSSVQAYGYLPEAANDSIFAIYAEKFGFVGSMVLLAVFVAFFARLKSIAERLDDDFTRLLVVGVLAWLSVQTLVNVGAMIGLLPLKGITLPFISYGGTSVVFVAAAVGLVFQASQYTAFRVSRASGSSEAPPAGDSRRLQNSSLRRAGYS
jgi:cell division protein FtsW